MKPSLLILAAGIGSRYGSLKQTEQFGPNGETITDYSIFDAVRSGFGKIVFVISPAMEQEFLESYRFKYPSSIDIDYVTQSINDVPVKYSITPERIKPWGTAHAVLRAADKIREPFAVINADDFYGREAYEVIMSFLSLKKTGDVQEFCLAGYPVANTLSRFGTVSRGVCELDANGFLRKITERPKIKESGNKIVFIDDGGREHELSRQTLVSMNLFGFVPQLFTNLQKQFEDFIARYHNDPKTEMYLPSAVDQMVKEGSATVKVLKTNAVWFGLTYKDDRPYVMNMINELIRKGEYPEKLWKA